MPFFDWFSVLGTGIQSTFAWATFNRDAFVDNVSMRQQQRYQQRNYHISWIAIARDDIRDMMGISVNRINNYMIVGTLILSIAGGTLVSVTLDSNCPDFLVLAFYLSIGTSIVFLMLSIMFGVKGQNCAFTNTMSLLTYQVRPENPAEYSHDYMKQAQWIEQNGLQSLFRIPGVFPNYHTAPETVTPDSFANMKGHVKDSTQGVNLEDATPLESLVRRSSHTWYLTKFAEFMRLWHPYDTYSKFSMGLGVIALGQGSAYFMSSKLAVLDTYLSPLVACIVTATFMYMVVTVTIQNFKSRNPLLRFSAVCFLVAGPALGNAAAIGDDLLVLQQVVVPIAFLSHCIFWVCCFKLAQNDLFDDKLDLIRGGQGNWSSSNGETIPDSVEHNSSCRDRRRGHQHSEVGRMPESAPEMRGSSDTWPTDSMDFEEKAATLHEHIKFTVRLTLAVSAFLWFGAAAWAAVKYWIDPLERVWRVPEEPVLTSALVEQASFRWPSPLFRPHAFACAAGQYFATDGLRVFEVFKSEGAMEVFCRVENFIDDIAPICNRSVCHPLALVRGRSGAQAEVIDCATGDRRPILQETRLAKHFAVLPGTGSWANPQRLEDQRIMVIHEGGEVAQYVWSQDGQQLKPEWYVGHFGSSLNSIGVDGGRLLAFYSALKAKDTVVEAYNMKTMRQQGKWRIPRTELLPLTAGCPLEDSSSALALSAAGLQLDGPGPQALLLQLHGSKTL